MKHDDCFVPVRFGWRFMWAPRDSRLARERGWPWLANRRGDRLITAWHRLLCLFGGHNDSLLHSGFSSACVNCGAHLTHCQHRSHRRQKGAPR